MEADPVKDLTGSIGCIQKQDSFFDFQSSPPSYQTLPAFSPSAPESPPPYTELPFEQEQSFSCPGNSGYNQTVESRRSSHSSEQSEDRAPLLDQPLGVREVVLRKDYGGKVGLTVKHYHNGIFISVVQANSPACLAGLECGDQILQINGEFVSSYSVPKVHGIFKRPGFPTYRLVIRERRYLGTITSRHSVTGSLIPTAYASTVQSIWAPVTLRRTMTFEKDHWGHIGFGFRNGVIHMIVGGSPAARSGLLINHHLIEVNGRNVMGMKDKDVGNIIRRGGKTITLTIAGAHDGF